MRRVRSTAALCAGALGAAMLTGCGGTDTGACLPAPLELSRTSVEVGLTVIVSSAAAGCDLGELGSYDLTLTAGMVEQSVGRFDVDADGSFEARVAIPAGAEPGPAVLSVTGSPYDDCPVLDDGLCTGYAVDLDLTA
ncbi:MAG TPA: hypothetical protein VGC67_05910 [Cellulomonas sp.]